ncbi:hypothetical protein [Actinocrispum wychmicini]|uniref:Cell wall-active antibiotic response 4TMS protein YvqF n=1 Tax=Actinocrispum wychmicini TaxID=1213861 RepID=A0A4R2JSA8_9PSEU|nr:hypothetical protein [Actinocrispum wychmicini]TCO59759.1 hypothetical protein EV192_104602 [Actinocrispum wychmicini]
MDITENTSPVRVDADHTMTKHLGNWTTSQVFEVRARAGAAVVDLRSPDIPDGDIEIRVDLDRGMLKLLVPDGARVEHFGHLEWTGRGRVKDSYGTQSPDGRVIKIVGRVHRGEIRVHRGGVAILSAMASRAYLEDLRHAHRTGTMPTVDDPTRTTFAPK